ncbi:hypothetical protein Goshw_011339, partial [Gossypium schwendimanii]|nr:hypothetical protein [Gossypium schwendimanii]
MWFQSHSTCPLCRNPIVVDGEFKNPSHLVSGDEANVQAQFSLQMMVSSGGACLEEGASASSSNGSSAVASTSGRQEGMLMIDVPTNGNENSPEEES